VRDLLSRVAIFDGIPAEGLARLAQLGRVRRFSYGKQLMVQGRTADMMYVIARGRVRLDTVHPELTETVFLAELGPGAILGQEGLLDGETHSATATAIDETEAIELAGIVLSVTILKFPKVASSLLHALSRRLRTTDDLTEAILARHTRQPAERALEAAQQ